MSDYDSHGDLLLKIKEGAGERSKDIEEKLRVAFKDFIRTQSVEVVYFSEMGAGDLSRALRAFPSILKPVLVSCNIAARAIERDIGIKNVDTYVPKLTEEQAALLAGYIKPFLPPQIAIPALCALDLHFFLDKEMRAKKGEWEKLICQSLSKFGKSSFKKRKFKFSGQAFELDAASPEVGLIELGVDVKRVEARRDIHKRSDEIVNKADKFKACYPAGKFAVVIYYPFVDEQLNIQNRLSSTAIDSIVFAGASSDSIDNAVRILLIKCGYNRD